MNNVKRSVYVGRRGCLKGKYRVKGLILRVLVSIFVENRCGFCVYGEED